MSHLQDTSVPNVLSQSSCLSAQFREYFSNALFSDCTVRIPHPSCNNVDMKTHRFILASRSEYFKRSLILKAIEEENALTTGGGVFGSGISSGLFSSRERIFTFPLSVELIPSFLLFLDFAYTTNTTLTIDNVWNAYHVSCILESNAFQDFCESYLISFLEETLEKSEKAPLHMQETILSAEQLQFIVHSIHRLKMKKVQQWLVVYLEEATKRQMQQQTERMKQVQETQIEQMQHRTPPKEANIPQPNQFAHKTPPHDLVDSTPGVHSHIPHVHSRLHRRRSTIDILQSEHQHLLEELVSNTHHHETRSTTSSFVRADSLDTVDTLHSFQNFQFPPPSDVPQILTPQHGRNSLELSLDNKPHSTLSPHKDAQFTPRYFLSHSIAAIASYMKSERATIFLFQSEKLQSLAAISDQEIEISPYEGLAGRCHQTKKSILINNVSSDSSFSSRIDEETGFKTHSILCAPLECSDKDGGVSGVLQVLNRIGGLFSPDDERRLSVVAEFIGHCILLLSQAVSQMKECVLVPPSTYWSLLGQNGWTAAPSRHSSSSDQPAPTYQTDHDVLLTTFQVEPLSHTPELRSPNIVPEHSAAGPSAGIRSPRTPDESRNNTTRKRSSSNSGDSTKEASKKRKRRNSMSDKMGHFRLQVKDPIVFHTVRFDQEGNYIHSGRKRRRSTEGDKGKK